jgi:hypothetical protein
MELENEPRDGRAYLTVKAVARLPEAVARYAADALTQLRAAIEYTLVAEVEDQLGRQLTGEEERSIEMPVYDEQPKFAKWLTDKRSAAVTPLHEGAELAARISELQPFQETTSKNTHCGFLRRTPISPNIARRRLLRRA